MIIKSQIDVRVIEEEKGGGMRASSKFSRWFNIGNIDAIRTRAKLSLYKISPTICYHPLSGTNQQLASFCHQSSIQARAGGMIFISWTKSFSPEVSAYNEANESRQCA